VTEAVPPAEIAREFGVSATVVRRWLRTDTTQPGDRWLLDDHTAARRSAARAQCTTDRCTLAVAGRGLCRKHYNRWHRSGSTDGLERGAHQKAKTHCPAGHPYDEENSAIFADRRRRCRTCRRRYRSINS